MQDLGELAAEIKQRHEGKRMLVALAGAPGSGKSTSAEILCEKLNENEPSFAEVFPMDGYHFDDILLKKLGRHERKGAPDTFDVSGFSHMLQRLRKNVEQDVIVPLFDREIEIARAGAHLISQDVNVIIVEGNYLLLDQAPWDVLKDAFDMSVFIDVPDEELERRLRQRWIDHGLDEKGILRKLDEVDMPNCYRIRKYSRKADFIIKHS